MVVVEVVLGDQFPVSLELPHRCLGQAQHGEIMASKSPRKGCDIALERLGIAIEIEKDRPVKHAKADRRQIGSLPGEIMRIRAAEMRSRAQLAVQAIGPGMAGAPQNRLVRAGLFHHYRAAVTADIMKGPDLTVTTMHQYHRLARNRGGENVTGSGNIVDAHGIHPGACEKPFVLEFQPPEISVTDVGQTGTVLSRRFRQPPNRLGRDVLVNRHAIASAINRA